MSQRFFHIREITASQEFLASRTPFIYRTMIWIFLSLAVSGVVWITFGEMEEVVKTSGFIRPINNVSSVKNIIPGKIEALSFKPGQIVHKGDLLFTIEQKPLLAQKSSLESQIVRIAEQHAGLQQLLNSYLTGKAQISTLHPEAMARFESFLLEKERLSVQFEMANKLWEEETRLPTVATSSSKIREFKNQAQLAKIVYEKYPYDFESQIRRELDSSQVEEQDLNSRLEQVKLQITNCLLTAPIDGIVQEVSSLNSGDFLQVDQEVIRIVPKERDAYKVELRLPVASAGKILEGQEVKLRFPSFPFNEFGGAVGKITKIAPDSEVGKQGEAYFILVTTLDRLSLADHNQRSFPLKVGLQVDARILLKKQTILFYLLEKLDFFT